MLSGIGRLEVDSQSELVDLEQRLQILLLPSDPNDDSNIFLEIRAGTGGDEAALFAGDLYRMYLRYAEQLGWQIEAVLGHARRTAYGA